MTEVINRKTIRLNQLRYLFSSLEPLVPECNKFLGSVIAQTKQLNDLPIVVEIKYVTQVELAKQDYKFNQISF